MVGLIEIATGKLWEIDTPSPVAGPSKGGFDPFGNAWFGGRGGVLVKLDPKTRQVTEYVPPTPFVAFYECMPDKNGEIWAAEMHAGRFARFNPKTEEWVEYVLPEPYSHNRRTWIDNSTDPVSVWYVDQEGYIVRLQPLD
jgi:streptogramin lyase